jgi:hypothetical protein
MLFTLNAIFLLSIWIGSGGHFFFLNWFDLRFYYCIDRGTPNHRYRRIVKSKDNFIVTDNFGYVSLQSWIIIFSQKP